MNESREWGKKEKRRKGKSRGDQRESGERRREQRNMEKVADKLGIRLYSVTSLLLS